MRTRKIYLMLVGIGAVMTLASCSRKDDAIVKDVDTTAQEATKAVENAADNVAAVPVVTVIREGQHIPDRHGKPQIIDFNATWCGPCKRFAPTFELIAQRYSSDAEFYSIDVDDNPQLAADYNVESIPTVIYINPDGSYSATMGCMDATDFNHVVQSFLAQS